MSLNKLFSLEGRTALVTGGSRGIGKMIAAGFIAQGAKVYISSRKAPACDDTAAELGPNCIPLPCDVSTVAGCKALAEQLAAHEDKLDILVNNAGAATSAPFLKSDAEAFRAMLALNLEAPAEAARLVLPGMLTRRWGRIVNVASTAGLKGYAYVSAYVAAKHGLVGLTRALALEVAAKGVTVNAVCPGFTETELVARSVQSIVAKTGRSEEEARAALAASNPQGRLITPDEVAQTIVWLCGEGASGVNGTAVPVAGGEL